MPSPIHRYRRFAATCAATDYASRASVRRHNAAVDAMRRLAAEPGAVGDLSPLLDDPQSGPWLAFQLLELAHPSEPVVERCLAIVRKLAEGDGAEAMGARMWLREHADRTA